MWGYGGTGIHDRKELQIRIYGPYTRRDGRKHIVKIYHNKDGSIKKRVTVSYPKFLVERMLGRKLKENETVDHIDGNFKNDRPSNLRVINNREHARQDSPKSIPKLITCVWCDKKIKKERGQLRHNSKLEKAGPFCGRSCAGKYGKSIQMGGIRLKIQPKPKLKTIKRKKNGGIRL